MNREETLGAPAETLSVQKKEWSVDEIKDARSHFSDEEWVDFLLKLNKESSSWYKEIDIMILDLSQEKIDAILGNLGSKAKVKFLEPFTKDFLNKILLKMSLEQFSQFIVGMNQEELTSLVKNCDYYAELSVRQADEKMAILVKEIKKQFELDQVDDLNGDGVANYLAWLKSSKVFTPKLFYRNKDNRKIEMAMAAAQYAWVKTLAEIRDGIPTEMWLKFLEGQSGYRMSPDCLDSVTMSLRPDLLKILKSGVTEEFYPQWSHLIGRSFRISRIPATEQSQSTETVDLIMEGVSEEDWRETMDVDKLVEIIREGNLILLQQIKSKLSAREEVEGQRQPISATWSRLIYPSTLKAVLIARESRGLTEEISADKRIAILELIVEGVDSETIRSSLLGQSMYGLFIEMEGKLDVDVLRIFRQKMNDYDWNIIMKSHRVGENILSKTRNNREVLQFILDNTENDVLVQMLNTHLYKNYGLPLFLYSQDEMELIRNKIGRDNWLKVISHKPYDSNDSPIERAVKNKDWGRLGFLVLDYMDSKFHEFGEETRNILLQLPVVNALSRAVSVEKTTFSEFTLEQKSAIWKGHTVALKLWDALALPMHSAEDFDLITRATFNREITMPDAISDETMLASYVKTGNELSKYSEEEAVNVNDVIREIGIRLLVPLAILKIGRGVSVEKLREIISKSVSMAQKMILAGNFEISNNSSIPLSVKELLDLSKQWHLNHSVMPREIVDLLDWKEWKSLVGNDDSDSVAPSFFEYSVDSQKIGVSVLTDSDLLAQESGSLDHCVGRGGYDVKCAQGRAHILSIKVFDGVEKKWISSSTVELNNNLEVIQHFGKRNSQPRKAELEAVKLFIADIKSKRLKKTEKLGETAKSLSWAKDLEARLGSDSKFRSIGFVPSVEKVQAVMEHYAHLSWKVKNNKDGSVELRSIFCPKIVSRKVGGSYLHRTNFFVDGPKGRVLMNSSSLIDAILPTLDYWTNRLMREVNQNSELELKSLSEIFSVKK